jgi:hypothetical protein
MTESQGTYSELVELSQREHPPARKETPPKAPKPTERPVSPASPAEDLFSTPNISQNYRFTEDELRWLRTRSFELTEEIGTKVSQNMILRIALRDLREACDRNPTSNPLSRAVSRLKR